MDGAHVAALGRRRSGLDDRSGQGADLVMIDATLNIADLALRLQEVPADQAALVRVAAMLLMIVWRSIRCEIA